MKLFYNFRVLATAALGGILVSSSACSIDSLDQATAPQSMSVSQVACRWSGSSGSGSTTFSDMSQDGTYNVAIDPNVANTLVMAGSRLEIPAGAVCAIGASGYGPTFWNAPCAPELRVVQLTVTVNSTSGSGASIDFSPALRFSPLSNVVLTMSAPNVSQQDVKNWVILYCSTSTSTTSGNGSGGSGSGKDGSKCVNESLNDKDLQTYVNYDLKQLFRRIKHFSMYRVSDGGYLLTE